VKEFTPDLQREGRTGIPEVVLAEGKRPEQLTEIARSIVEANGMAILTRVSEEQLPALRGLGYPIQYHAGSRVCVLSSPDHKPKGKEGRVGILTAGTLDIPVAQEAQEIAAALGCDTIAKYDVGIAGVHRLFGALSEMGDVDVYIVAAGREGALPTLVAGLVDKPVIGLPVSTGYGFGGKGEAALGAMLQSCAPLVVVNIDAGFVAGAVASRIAKARIGKGRGKKR